MAALEGLARAMFVEVMELRRERRRALESRTLAGHAKNLLGYCFSAYCLYRRAGCAHTQLASCLLRIWQFCECVSSSGPLCGGQMNICVIPEQNASLTVG